MKNFVMCCLILCLGGIQTSLAQDVRTWERLDENELFPRYKYTNRFIEVVREDQTLSVKRWSNDSIYHFDLSGKPSYKSYEFDTINHSWRKTVNVLDSNEIETREELGTFSQPKSQGTYQKNGQIYESFQRDPEVYHTRLFSQSPPFGLIRAVRFDFAQSIHFDTTFHQNGQIWTVSAAKIRNIREEKPEGDSLIYAQIFDENGKSTLPPNTPLRIGKDYANCLYGFQNGDGTWKIPPQYESISLVGTLPFPLFIVEFQGKKGVLNYDGAVILPIIYEKISTFKPRSTNDATTQGRIQGRLYERKMPLPNLDQLSFIVTLGDRQGIIDARQNWRVKPVFQADWFISYEEWYKLLQNPTNCIVKLPNLHMGVADTDGNLRFETPENYLVRQNDGYFSPLIGRQYKDPIWGLVDSMGQRLLPTHFEHIFQLDTHRFLVMTLDSHGGIFDAQRRNWIFDTSYKLPPIHIFHQHNQLLFLNFANPFLARFESKSFIGIQKTPSNLFGIIDESGKTLMPFEYDDLLIFQHFEAKSNRFLPFFRLKKGKNVGIWNPVDKNWKIPLGEFEDIIPFWFERDTKIPNLSDHPKLRYAVWLKKNNKWTVHYFDDRSQAHPRAYDDLARVYFGTQRSFLHASSPLAVVAVWGDSVEIFSDLFFPHPIRRSSSDVYRMTREITADQLTTVSGNRILLNEEKRNIILLAKNLKTHQGNFGVTDSEIIRFDSKKKYPIPPNIAISTVLEKSELAVLEDSTTNLFGYFDFLNQKSVPPQYFAVADAPFGLIWTQSPNSETWELRRVDQSLVFDRNFDMPFTFQRDFGVGQVDGKLGLFHKNGRELIPPQYERLVPIDSTIFAAELRTRAGETQFLLLDTANCPLISEYFDFLSHNLIVKKGNKIGMLNLEGNWIAPLELTQTHSKNLLSISANFIENIYSSQPHNIKKFLESPEFGKVALFDQHFLSNQILVEMLTAQSFEPREKFPIFIIPNTIFTKKVMVENFKTLYLYFYSYNHLRNENGKVEFLPQKRKRFGSCLDIVRDYQISTWAIDSQFLGAILTNEKYSKSLNFRKNPDGIWERVACRDLFLPDFDQKLNQILLKKLMELKSENLDCLQSNELWKIAEPTFLISPTGITWFFPRPKPYKIDMIYWNHAAVQTTWTELRAILKR